uniref:SAM domain-containing protein n=1 Tax=Opuntia streptacantha TaxID=393608 RepID=A0A7C9D616_OPUST
MAAELQPPASPGAATVAASDNPGAALAPKRQRRPSVRLGDIGEQSGATWRLSGKTSKTRPLTNLVTPNSDYSTDTATTTPTPHNNGKFKFRRTPNSAKRLRTRIDPAPEDTEKAENNDNVSFHDEEEGFRDFAREGSEQEQRSPVHSGALFDAWNPHNRMSLRAANAGAASDSHRHLGIGLGLELDDGVRNWLVGLGLGRYAPVFEIHEVDDEVLPYLTLEDLKDMGINAVGSRRKLYSAILNLQKRLL